MEKHGARAIDASAITFKEAADRYSAVKLIPVKYVDGVRVAGLRSPSPKIYIKILNRALRK